MIESVELCLAGAQRQRVSEAGRNAGCRGLAIQHTEMAPHSALKLDDLHSLIEDISPCDGTGLKAWESVATYMSQ
jgi:hypothetical protein